MIIFYIGVKLLKLCLMVLNASFRLLNRQSLLTILHSNLSKVRSLNEGVYNYCKGSLYMLRGGFQLLILKKGRFNSEGLYTVDIYSPVPNRSRAPNSSRARQKSANLLVSEDS